MREVTEEMRPERARRVQDDIDNIFDSTRGVAGNFNLQLGPQPTVDIDFSQVVPQGDVASGSNNLGNADNVGNIDTSSFKLFSWFS